MCGNGDNAESDLDRHNNLNNRYRTHKGVSYNTAVGGGKVRLGGGTSGPIVNLEGFLFEGSNNKKHFSICKKKREEHYGFVGGKGWGFNCFQISRTTPRTLDVSPGEKDVSDMICVKHTKEIITEVELDYNLIFYPRKVNGISINLSKSIYLHELGHQIDTWVTLSEEELIKKEQFKCEFYGDDAVTKYHVWSAIINELASVLLEEHFMYCYYKSISAKCFYHKVNGTTSNPWEENLGYLYPKNEEEKDGKELAKAEENWRNAKIKSANVKKDLDNATK